MTAVDPWQKLLSSWDDQQAGYLPRREERFAMITRTIGEVIGDSFVALDLGCGPGSLSQRILAAHPAATAIAVDSDPLLLELGQHALSDYADRLRWVDADLRDPRWHESLGVDGVDVVVSTTALHWLEPGVLFEVYRRAARLLRPGGILLNGDNMPYDAGQATHERLAESANERAAKQAFAVAGVPDWERWWADATSNELLAAAAGKRTARRERADQQYGPRDGDLLTSLSTHVTALTEAGFREIGTIWQNFDDRILLAVR
ncbi:class I SAM-dependent methyltransferase [Micromonospora eburnea]|uniref:Methyltransferase domain-containing protein n=1 Tax=Micromonospora eburnea TaxID=227316 RepID=A0A1C6UZX1_9ACTN|nr:class I SAM-dependent methyltransferase [Micromonospora eburnea]SCL59625.1 Methyltransferase domain-containing protein [Micromonospora eburnea]